MASHILIREALTPQERYRVNRRYRHAVERLLETLEDRLEDLAISQCPAVQQALLRMIAEVLGHDGRRRCIHD